MKKILMYAFTLILAICLPILSMAETFAKSDVEDVITANELESIITESDLNEEISFSFFSKPKAYQVIWKCVKNDDNCSWGLYKYPKSFDVHPDDYVVVWKVDGKTYAEHIFCYAARENKMDAGVALVYTGQIREKCATGKGQRRDVRYDPKQHNFWDVTYVQELNPKLACYAFKEDAGFGFSRDAQKDYPLAVKGGCGDYYIKHRYDNFKFPRDYSFFTTGKAWLQLAAVRRDLVSDERFQKHLHDYYYNDSADDEETQKKLKKLLIEK